MKTSINKNTRLNKWMDVLLSLHRAMPKIKTLAKAKGLNKAIVEN